MVSKIIFASKTRFESDKNTAFALNGRFHTKFYTRLAFKIKKTSEHKLFHLKINFN